MKKIIIGVSVVVLVILSVMAIKFSYADRIPVATPDEPMATYDEPLVIPEETETTTELIIEITEPTTVLEETTEPTTEAENSIVETKPKKPSEPKKEASDKDKNKDKESGEKPTKLSTPDTPKENLNETYLGKFKLTAYCNCKKCCGKWSGGPTASGKMPKAGRTIAVDPKIIPLGTKVVINGKTYTAEDTGSAIKNKRIDVYFDSHQAALNFGVQYAKVYLAQ